MSEKTHEEPQPSVASKPDENVQGSDVMPNQRELVALLAHASGNLHRAGLRNLRRLAREAKREPYSFMILQLDEMQRDGVFQDKERHVLERVIGLVMGKHPTADPFRDLRRLRDELLSNRSGSPLAVAIASIALDSLEASADRGSPTGGGIVFSKAGAADLMGALSGGNAGSKAGTLGLVVGAVAGGLGASFLMSDDDEDDEDEVLLFEDIKIPTPT